MAVILIIAILASITAVGVNRAKERARQADCMSNLRQLGTALVTYRADHGGRNPGWLSNLYPIYLDDQGIYVCRSDKAHGGGDCRMQELVPPIAGQEQVYDHDGNDTRMNATLVPQIANEDIHACSYFYEFSAAPSPWPTEDTNGDGFKTWAEFKERQLAEGDAHSELRPYSSSRMPIIRCYHHVPYGKISGHERIEGAPASEGNVTPSGITLNVAYAGNVTIAPLWWEGALEASERR